MLNVLACKRHLLLLCAVLCRVLTWPDKLCPRGSVTCRQLLPFEPGLSSRARLPTRNIVFHNYLPTLLSNSPSTKHALMDGTLPRRDDGEQLQHPFGEQRNSSLRRLACDACRARKVRCDRRDPPCSRCAKVGIRCRYSSRLKPPASKMDLSQFLLTLDTRLS
jgi:hypothetical protein